MSGTEHRLGRCLAATAPELYESLQRSWKIAREQWLPALATKMGSTNAESHLYSVERHLDDLLVEDDGADVPRLRVPLEPVEVYALLASVLFHDLGNGVAKQNDTEDHGDRTGRVLFEGDRYAVLGIPCPEMARSIGRISAMHSKRAFDVSGLRTGTIDPFGAVGERRLAAFLYVADRMDSAYSRALPKYIRTDERIEIVGAFRRLVRGVRSDLFGGYVETVLGDFSSGNHAAMRAEELNCTLPEGSQFLKMAEAEGHGEGFQASILENEGPDFVRSLIESYGEIDEAIPLVGALLPNRPFRRFEKLLLRQIIKVDKAEGNQEAWPPTTMLAALVGDVFANNTALRTVRNELRAAGLPLHAWLINVNGRLFNSSGEETYEPILTPNYMRDLIDAMWQLGTSVFGTRHFTYKNLADKVYEDQVRKVKVAVRRISILSENAWIEGYGGRAVVWASEGSWGWNGPGSEYGKNPAVSQDVKLALRSHMKNLGKPTGDLQ